MGDFSRSVHKDISSKFRQLLFASLMGLISAPSHAALIDAGAVFQSAPGAPGTAYGFTTDTASGLDWLDISNGTTSSYSAMQLYMTTSNSFFSGWHYATLSELMGFMNNFVDSSLIGFDTVGVGGALYSMAGYSKVEIALNGVAANVFAHTGTSFASTNTRRASGILADTDSNGNHLQFMIATSSNYGSPYDSVSYAYVNPDVGSANWLVRDNPE